MINIKTLEKRVDDNKFFWWSVAVIAGLLFRFVVLYVTYIAGKHADFSGFYKLAFPAYLGKNIYSNTHAYNYAYNYGILFSMICGQLYGAAQLLGGSMLTYKILHVGFLTLCDFVIAKIVERKAGTLWGILFFLNPVSIIVDSYNTQHDNVAVMFGALGILCIEESCGREKFGFDDLLGVIFLSLSLITKHFMYAFPVYILFSARIKTRKKILYAFIPPLLFLIHFIPYWSEGADEIIHYVFLYRSHGNFPVTAVRFWNWENLFFTPAPIINHICLAVFTLLMIASAYIFRRENILNSFLIYTIAVVCFASGFSSPQLAIPCLAVLVLFREKSLLYFALILTWQPIATQESIGRQLMLTAEAWCLLAYLVYYYRRENQRVL